jgi:hypothetical protein
MIQPANQIHTPELTGRARVFFLTARAGVSGGVDARCYYYTHWPRGGPRSAVVVVGVVGVGGVAVAAGAGVFVFALCCTASSEPGYLFWAPI